MGNNEIKYIKVLVFILSVIIISVIYLANKNNNDIDYVVKKQWKNCKEDTNCIIDFATAMNFEWDTMCFFSSACSLEEIHKDLGFCPTFTDIGDRIIFLYKGLIVYQKEWFKNPELSGQGIIFYTKSKKFKIGNTNAKFRIKKSGNFFYLIKQ